MTRPTLLEKALAVPVRARSNGKVNLEEVEIALAWLQDKVTISQISKVMGMPPGSAYARLSRMLRTAYEAGYLQVREAGEEEVE